ncbi:hypothetical protein B0J14DRAFT_572164 [Halenospora varia]|nr:hypothetical protein B0J14DRAFT_572164 [Halenospora varia]
MWMLTNQPLASVRPFSARLYLLFFAAPDCHLDFYESCCLSGQPWKQPLLSRRFIHSRKRKSTRYEANLNFAQF